MIMILDEFVKMFADQFDDTDPSEMKAETYFRELDEWSSLTGLAVINIVAKKCDVKITAEEFRKCETVEDVYNLVQSKK